MSLLNDDYYMDRALELARKGMGRTSPNPVVGAVIVNHGEIVGEGYHKKAGTLHAEIHALNVAKLKARGSKMYVTLEPCSHYGRTPPCTEAIIRAGVKEVIVATLDPNPQVAGRGIKFLQEAGIKTSVGIKGEEAKRQNEVFFKYITRKTPFICMKYAMTLDGKIATYSGDAKWISNAKSRNYVHQLRDIYDAILVGIGTIIADNPTLNTRLEKEDVKDPIRIIIDGKLELPFESNIVQTSKLQKTIIFTAEGYEQEKAANLMQAGIEIIPIAGEADKLDLNEVVDRLGDMGITSILVEGGAQINASFLENKLADKILSFIAPKIVGGKAPSPVTGQGIKLMRDAYEFKLIEVEQFGNDTLIKAYTGW
ncbi:MAG TPA: bifunctional diaminohydroxyphosphoribosylaminopyrimidine deaminase/5-amino-6-(5-phosphoribosylamino)uracil reductase RibD [Syntrophomonadaceae bacterium]|nr:bifunctional diaminohydroxyphosphoribosylaminopyrimidine deaminase/5-amino-6-(5-phosphoribosylamino)uracil reductase RibD [Syntrophomonadaceae bacterium]